LRGMKRKVRSFPPGISGIGARWDVNPKGQNVPL
jgi:hypothetical protein